MDAQRGFQGLGGPHQLPRGQYLDVLERLKLRVHLAGAAGSGRVTTAWHLGQQRPGPRSRAAVQPQVEIIQPDVTSPGKLTLPRAPGFQGEVESSG